MIDFQSIAGGSANVGLAAQNMNGCILWANNAYCQMTGYKLDEIMGRNPMSFALPPDRRPSAEALEKFHFHLNGPDDKRVETYRNVRKNGEAFWMELFMSFATSPEGEDIAVFVCRDVSIQIDHQNALRDATGVLEKVAATDSLTGLANRNEVITQLGQGLKSSHARGTKIGILHLDLDHFKEVNDTFGHSAGDAVLRHVAHALQVSVGLSDMPARIGGDEFVVICPDIGGLSELKIIGDAIISAVRQPIYWDGFDLRTNVSVGAAIAPASSITPEEFLRRSDFALYEAKRAGRGLVAPYDEALHARHRGEMRLAKDLRAAVKNDELDYYFQPTISLNTGRIKGFETLVRWKNERLGQVSPAEFLPVAKSLGLMAAIDFGALRAALNLKKKLNNAGYKGFRLGINGSEELLGHPAFFETLMTEMRIRNITPSEIVIEVLETVVFDDVSQSNPLVLMVQRLHDAGFVTLLDDFGTGHAGLTHLAKLAVSGVKIDRSLTTNILTDKTSSKIIAMMLDLCADLNLYTVTEGIETAEEASALRDIGGDVIQGYWLSPAMPGHEVLDWLATRPDIMSIIDTTAIAPAAAPRYLKAN